MKHSSSQVLPLQEIPNRRSSVLNLKRRLQSSQNKRLLRCTNLYSKRRLGNSRKTASGVRVAWIQSPFYNRTEGRLSAERAGCVTLSFSGGSRHLRSSDIIRHSCKTCPVDTLASSGLVLTFRAVAACSTCTLVRVCRSGRRNATET